MDLGSTGPGEGRASDPAAPHPTRSAAPRTAPLRVVCAPDSFKESMTAPVAAAAMARGVRRARPDARCVELPMADGGEGTTEVIATAAGGRLLPVATRDALGRPTRGVVAVLADADLGIVEVAAAVGLGLVPPEERDPLTATSAGVADLVRAVLDAGVGRIVVGLGGSATNDGGAGLLAALGVRLLDAEGRDVPAIPTELVRVATVDPTGLDPRLREVELTIASDVTNPLLGPNGATAVFGPQKEVRPADVPVLEEALAAWVGALELATGREVRERPGAGAAGGIGAALLAIGAGIRPGVEVVAEAVGLAAAVADADLVLTGEGSLDAQTLAGKTPAGVAALARRHGVPVVAFAGRVANAEELLGEGGFAAVVPIVDGDVPLDRALREGEVNLERAAATVARYFSSFPR